VDVGVWVNVAVDVGVSVDVEVGISVQVEVGAGVEVDVPSQPTNANNPRRTASMHARRLINEFCVFI
jgi:hypothetical protein